MACSLFLKMGATHFLQEISKCLLYYSSISQKTMFFILLLFLFQKVRAGSLQELVYKGGQAGITKASVTLTFDNREKKQSPLGYEQYEEITVTRQVRCNFVASY
jgi:hypothetical protein